MLSPLNSMSMERSALPVISAMRFVLANVLSRLSTMVPIFSKRLAYAF